MPTVCMALQQFQRVLSQVMVLKSTGGVRMGKDATVQVPS